MTKKTFEGFKESDWIVEQSKTNGYAAVGGSDKVCSHKGYKVKIPYLKWIEFAEKETAKGNIQKQCKNCLRWFFPSEF